MGLSRRKWCMISAMLLLSMLCAGVGYGQTFGEFFNQKKTQKRYLLQQIAALQVYMGYAKKGYEIVGSGIDVVKGITDGEFSLHRVFLGSLKLVSPFIRNHEKVGEILSLQLAVSGSFSGLKQLYYLSPSNQAYVFEVRHQLIAECGTDLEELLMVISSGQVEMSDEERLSRLSRIHEAMRDKYAFARSFCAEVSGFILSVKSGLESNELMRRQYEIN